MSDLSLYRWSEFDVCRGEHYNNFLEGASSFINNVLGASLPKEIIKLNCPVANISWGSNNSDNIEVVTEDNKSFFAHCVLVTCSIGVLKANQETLFSPELPPVLREALNSSGFGPIGKILLKWDEPWWPAGTEGFQFLWPKDYINCCDDQRHLSEDDLIRNWPKSITGFDPVLDSPKWLLGWLGGPEAKFVETISEKEVGEKCAKLLEDFTGYKVSLPDEVYV
jgi:spermine oxidase